MDEIFFFKKNTTLFVLQKIKDVPVSADKMYQK